MTQTNTAERRVDEERKPGGGLSIRVIFNAVRRHPLVFTGVLLFAGSIGAGIWFFLPLPKKTAAVTFHVSSQPTSILSGGDNRLDFASYKQSQLMLIKSRRTLNEVLNPKGKNKDLRIMDLEIIRTADPDPLTWLDKHLIIETKLNSEYITVKIEGDNEDELLALLSAITVAYKSETYARDNDSRVSRLTDLEHKVIDTEKKIDTYRDLIANITKRIGIDGAANFDERVRLDAVLKAAEEHAAAVAEVETNNAALTAARDNLQAFRNAPRRTAIMAVGSAVWVTTTQGGESPSQGVVLRAAMEDALRQDEKLHEYEDAIESARKSILKIEELLQPGAVTPALVKARDLLKTAEENRDKYKLTAQARLGSYLKERAELAQELAVAKIQTDCNRSVLRQERAAKKVEKLKSDIVNAEEQKRQLEDYRTKIAEKEKYRGVMSDQLERMKLDLGSPQRVTVSEDPYVVLGIEGNRRLKYALMATLGAFLLGFGGLVMWEHRSRRVTRTDEVSTQLGMRLIGTIPPLKVTGESGAQQENNTPLVEAIDTTRIMLTHGSPEASKLRVLLVTSALSGEGKTTLSGNLAISLARAGFRTLLIDGDMQAPTAHVLFNLPDSPGLSELLRGEGSPVQAIRSSPIPGLSVLTAGRWNMSTRQSLVGDQWRMLKRQLESRFDFVVIDTSPLLLVSDAMLLAREADGVVLSVMLGVSQIARVAETVNRLNAIGAELAGVVVNNVQSEIYHSYMSRSKYAVAYCETVDDPSETGNSAADIATGEPIADELTTDLGTETKVV